MNVRLQLLLLCLVLVCALSLMVIAGRFAFVTGDRHPATGDAPLSYEETTRVRFDALVAGPDWRVAEPSRNPQGLLVAVHEASGLSFVLIPEGSFLMGSDDGPEDEGPVQRVRLDAFLLAETECTRSAFRQREGAGSGDGLAPVQGVSWLDCREWCETEGGGLRLPREAEWEYACRAGTTARWSCGEDPARLGAHAWYSRNSGDGPAAVGRKLPNAWGLFDMHGNLWEWCEDVWGGYATPPPDRPAESRQGGTDRVYRGGCWLSIARNCRAANRGRDDESVAFRYLGFRPAANLP